MQEEMQKVIQLVSDLNEEFYDITKNTEWTPFDFNTNGMDYMVIFMGISVFSSSSDVIAMDQTLKDIIMVEAVLMINDLHQFNKQRDRSDKDSIA